MSAAAFPHAYPFRFVDTVSQRATSGGGHTAPPEPPTSGGERTVPPEPPAAGFEGGRVRIRVTANARAAMGESWQTGLLYPEAIAQAALLLQGGDPEAGRRGYLAGITGLSIERAPQAGETLEILVRLQGRFGAMLRFDGEVFSVDGAASGGELVARGSVLVRQGDVTAEAAR
jgi:3-hydroxymyristoyl/3-hydroxydecanoyl-(acyl carrier protein) dehydratase